MAIFQLTGIMVTVLLASLATQTLAPSKTSALGLLPTEYVPITAPLLATGAVELLNEVSTSKITGEEEIFSHTDLWDFQANVDGAAKIWKLFADPVKKKDAALAATVDQSLVNLNALLARHKTPKGFVVYTDLKPAEVKQLSAAVDALAEPLSKLGALVQAE